MTLTNPVRYNLYKLTSMSNDLSVRAIAHLSLAVSILLLFSHFYYYDYGAFDHWQLTTPLGDRVLQHIRDTGLFADPTRSKAFAVLFLGLSLLSSPSRKEQSIKKRPTICLIIVALVIYFSSSLLLRIPGEILATAILYMALTTLSFLLVLTCGSRLSRVLNPPWAKDDPFGRRQAGFPQEERRRMTDVSLHLRACYNWKGRQRDSWINVINPRRGILIMGSPGSGKSWFLIEPMIRQLIEKGFAMFIYDFKSPALTQVVYDLFLTHQDKYPEGTVFYSINPTDLTRSHRCNVLEPTTLPWVSDAIGASRTILLSMNKTWIHQQGEFFVESPINFLAAIIWFLRKYKNGVYCTLPHAIELAQLPYDQLFSLLNIEVEVQTLINPFIQSYQNKTMKLLDSQVASAKIPLGRLASPDLYYILTGNDLGLDINNPAAPKILCLAGDPPRQEALAPVLSLYIDRLSKLVNCPGRYPCALVCDEFATVRAYSMTNTIATARSNNIIPIIAVQDLSQLRIQYSRDEADQFLNITGNLLCGQVGGETARRVSELFPKVLRDRASISTNSHDTSISQSRQWEQAVTPATVATLSSGEFLGIVADDPGQKLELKAFHARLVREQGTAGRRNVELPTIHDIDAAIVQENFRQIEQDIQDIISAELPRMLANPILQNKDIDGENL